MLGAEARAASQTPHPTLPPPASPQVGGPFGPPLRLRRKGEGFYETIVEA